MPANADASSTTDAQAIEFPTLIQLKDALPKECFQSDARISMYYVVRALVLSGVFMYTLSVLRALPFVQANWIVDALCCSIYVFMQGVVFWGYFTIGHDCGHSSFSRYSSLNFVIGCLMHSLILTPFESWRLSHRYHHKNTGNIDKDEIFYPHRKSDKNLLCRQSLYSFGVAWFLYLACGFPPRKINHFNPWEDLFNRRVGAVIISIIAWFAVFLTSIACSIKYGLATVALYYYAPVAVFASFLVVVTFLHHNDEKTPWYADSEWTYVKGNLSSVDRDYGALINNLSHNIGTHQIHHLFPIIPHYKLVQATAVFREEYPHLKRECYEPILQSFIKTVGLYVKYGEVEDSAKYFSLEQSKKKAQKQE